jgi:predicted methyltransferase
VLFSLVVTACGGAQPGGPATQSPPPASQKGALAPAAAPSPAALSVVAAADRSDEDRNLDAGRHPAELLTFFGVASGMKVAELFAGRGYTTELLARAVGPSGTVYGENPKWVLEKFAEKPWSERLQKPATKNVVRLDRELDDPFPADVHDLDLVLSVLVYHDTVWLETDRDKMNRAVFRALKKGGVFGIVDHSAQAGAGVSVVKTLHRIEESVVRAEVERAGFRLRAEGSFLRNGSDARDWNDAPGAAAERRGTSDRFVLAFEKP